MNNQVELQLENMHQLREFFYSGDMKLLYAVLIFMGIDILTGWAKAIKNRNLWSTKSVYGAGRKTLVLFVIIMANIVDNVLGLNGVLVVGIMFYYIATEGLSILENLTEMNVPFPEVIKEKLMVMKKDSEKE